MEKLKKILMIASLVALVVAIGMLITAVFGAPIFSNQTLLRILLTSGTISVGSGIAINEIAVIKRKRILGFIGLALLGVSVVLALLLILTPLLTNTLVVRATAITSVTSILFITIISHYSKLENSMIGLQIVAYIVFIALDVLISLLIAGINIFSFPAMIEIFAVICILTVGFMIGLTVIGSKRKSSMEEEHKKVIVNQSIANNEENQKLKADMYNLNEENQKLKAELYNLKQENEKLKAEIYTSKSNNNQAND